VSDSEIVKLLVACAFAVAFMLAAAAVRRFRRKRADSVPFPSQWRELLKQSLPIYSRMPTGLRERLEPSIRAFLREVRFVGCDGLTVTDEMRLVVATQACLLTASRRANPYRDLMSVLIYPDTFVITRSDEDEAGIVTESEDAVSGEAQDTARIVLSWRDVTEPPDDGEIRNVVLHEFAHYLDHSVDGVLQGVVEEAYDAHVDALERGDETLIDPDGGENAAEFFAYATEAFFEAPAGLKRLHAPLYEALRAGYGLDPAAW
jgi:Mlc titration factor MtfA (ptsG expression regulator)